MKYNKAVYLTFIAGQSSSSVNISVPIQVKRIHCKALGYKTGTPPAAGAATYCYVVSDLTQNSPIGMYYRDSTYPYSSGQDIEYELQNPQPVNGTYTFSLVNFDGTPAVATVGNDYLGMILEFNDEYEPAH